MRTLFLIMALASICQPLCAQDNAPGIVIVANIDNNSINLSRLDVRNLFMGSSIQDNLTPVALTADNEVRSLFHIKIVGLTESRVQAYWAQMRFSGRKQPPKEVESISALINYLQQHPNSVGYLPGNLEVPHGLVEVYRLHQ